MDTKTRDVVLVQSWLAVSLRRGNGRGAYSEDDFEIIQSEPDVQFSQLELLRERLILKPQEGTLYSNGIAVQSSTLEWDDGYTPWSLESTDGEYDAGLSREGHSMFWESFLIESGCFWTRAQAEYKEILPLRGIEDPTIDIRLQTLADLPIEAAEIDSQLSLREWTLDAAALRIFLERPEYEQTKSIDLSFLRTNGAELSAMLQCGWHAKNVHELRLDGIKDLAPDCCEDMASLHTLSAKRVGWEKLEHLPNLHTLDVRDNPLKVVSFGTKLKYLGINTSTPEIKSLGALHHLHVRTLYAEHLPPALHSLSFEESIGDVDWSNQRTLRSVHIPFSAGLPQSPLLHTVHIIGGNWTRSSLFALRQRYPMLESLSIVDAHVDADALLDVGMLTHVAVRNCGVNKIEIPSSCQWRHLDLSDNSTLDMHVYDGLESLKSLHLSHTATSMSAVLFAGSLMGLETLIADGIRDPQACFSANALVSLQHLSLRSIEIPALEFLSKHAFVSLQSVDLGDNRHVYEPYHVDMMKPKLRIDPQHPQAQEIRWLWRQQGHADIFHENPLFFVYNTHR